MKHLEFTPQPCCVNHCRLWQETAGGLTPSNHSPGCKGYVRVNFWRITHKDGGSFVDTPENARDYLDNAEDREDYTTDISVFMTQDQFERLPEFQGF